MIGRIYSGLLLLILLVILQNSTRAQYGPHSLEIVQSGGFSTYSFQHDSLVFPRRRGQAAFGSEAGVAAIYQFHFVRQRLALKAGLGYGNKEIYMNKYNIGDLLASLFPFGGFRKDSSYLSHVTISGKYLVVPFSFNYRLTRNMRHGAQFFVGIEMSFQLLLRSFARVEFDSAYHFGSPRESEVLKGKYAAQMRRFLLSFAPHIDLRIRCYRNLGILFNLFPISFYGSSLTKEITSSGGVIGSSFGIYHNFSKR
jgi:hypothetical protein